MLWLFHNFTNSFNLIIINTIKITVSKIIIGIHGLGNKPSKEILTDWWLKSIFEGLEGINKNNFKVNFEMIYWASILNDKPLDESITDKNDPYFVNERYTKAPDNFVPNPHPFAKKY